jgi:hypothetical protein
MSSDTRASGPKYLVVKPRKTQAVKFVYDINCMSVPRPPLFTKHI